MTDLFPATAQALASAKIPYVWNSREHTVCAPCICGGKLTMDDEQPWVLCWKESRKLGERCPVENLPFQEILKKLVDVRPRSS